MRTWVLGTVVLVFGCAREAPPTASASDPVDAVAQAWVKLALEIDTHEPGFVDAYFGPAEWKASAQAAPRSVSELEAAADGLLARLRDAEDANACVRSPPESRARGFASR
jgi:hypothetical protein